MSSIFHDPLILLAVGTLSVAVAWKLSSLRSSGLPLPPGPKKLPLIGNLLDMPKNDEWVTYARWGKQYGSDLIHIQVAGSSIVVVNSAEVAHDLFDKRSTIYSSRPRFVMLNELMGWEWAVAHMPDGEMWRQHRRLFQKELHPSTTPTFQPAVTKFAHRLLVSIHQTPEDFMSHMRQ
ncbi:hypothetical protein ONZ45_g14371 [Pleurotus djamor]|nr:hypothetical protein ONZ45_g14371 [Pleurotus djamor]